MADETPGNAGTAHITVVPQIVGGAAASLVAGLTGPLTAALGTAATAGLAMGAALVAGIGVAFAAEVDFTGKLLAGTKQIRLTTGATGDELIALGQNFRNTVGTVAGTSVEDFAKATGDLNVRLGLTGPALEELVKQETRLAKLTKEDLGTLIPATTRLFGDWSVATDHQGSTLDYLFKVSQATGVGVTQLSEGLVKFGAPLRQLGFSMEDSAAILGKFEKEGVNTNLVMGSMRIALGKLAKAGEEPVTTYARLVDEIKNAGSTGIANSKALELFGARAGPDMAAAIREGRFEIGSLIKDIAASPETLKNAEESTRTFGERVGVIFAKLGVIFEPVGKAFYTFRTAVLDRVEAGINGVIALFQHTGEAADFFAKALGTTADAPGVEALINFFALIANFVDNVQNVGLGVALKALVEDIQESLPLFREVLLGLVDQITGFVVPLAEAVVGWGRAMIDKLVETWPKIVAWITENGPALLESFHTWTSAASQWVADSIGPLLQQLGQWAGAIVGWIFDHLPQIIGAIAVLAYNFTKWAGEIAGPLLIKLGELLAQLVTWIVTVALPHIWEKLQEWAAAFVAWIEPLIPPALEKLKLLLATIGTWITDVALPWLSEHLAQWGSAFWAWIVATVPVVLEKLGELQAALGHWILETALPWLVEKAQNLAAALIGWILTAIINLPENLQKLQDAIEDWLLHTAVPWLFEKAKELVPALLSFIDGLPAKIEEAAKGMFNGVVNAFLSAVNWIIRTWNGLSLKVPEVTIAGQTYGGQSLDTPDVSELPYLALGGRSIRPGLAVVGDQGAEIVRLARGDTVFPMDQVTSSRARGDGKLFEDVNIHEATNAGQVLTELDAVLGWRMGTRKTA